jgi:UDP-N-acetyl-D-mannosaminuronic acid dehydrogenase
VDAAVLQADHAAYRALGPEDLPGARVVVDGRRVLEPARFAAAGVVLRRLGDAQANEASASTTRAPARPSP